MAAVTVTGTVPRLTAAPPLVVAGGLAARSVVTVLSVVVWFLWVGGRVLDSFAWCLEFGSVLLVARTRR